MTGEPASVIAARQLAEEARARGSAVVRRRLAVRDRMAALHRTTTPGAADPGLPRS